MGCNITVEFKEDGVYRLKPRYHADINEHWMCDDGRLGYEYVNSEDRLQIPMKRENDGLIPTSWEDALQLIMDKLSAAEAESIVIIGSAQGTNEENYLLRKLAHDVLKTDRIGLFGRKAGEEHKFPQFTIEADKNPNTRGARDMLGASGNGNGTVLEGEKLWESLSDAKVVYLANGAPERPLTETERAALENVDFLIVQDIFPSDAARIADVVLPSTTFTEKDGSFTNSAGWVQRVRKATDPPGEARIDWEIIQQVAKRLTGEFEYHFAGEIAAEIAASVPGYSEATHQQIGDGGVKLQEI